MQRSTGLPSLPYVTLLRSSSLSGLLYHAAMPVAHIHGPPSIETVGSRWAFKRITDSYLPEGESLMGPSKNH